MASKKSGASNLVTIDPENPDPQLLLQLLGAAKNRLHTRTAAAAEKLLSAADEDSKEERFLGPLMNERMELDAEKKRLTDEYEAARTTLASRYDDLNAREDKVREANGLPPRRGKALEGARASRTRSVGAVDSTHENLVKDALTKAAGAPLRNTELVARTGLDKAIVSKVTKAGKAAGWIRQHGERGQNVSYSLAH